MAQKKSTETSAPKSKRSTSKSTKSSKTTKTTKKSKSLKQTLISLLILAVVFVGTMLVLRAVKPELCREIDLRIIEIIDPGYRFHEKPADSQQNLQSQAAGETENKTPGTSSTASSSSEGKSSGKSTSGAVIPTVKENSPLYFGLPTNATNNVSNSNDYLMEKPQFSLSYNRETLCPNWVMWHLAVSDTGDVERGDDFRPDDELPSEWYKVTKADYQYNKYNFDRGHVCPSADRTDNAENNSMTFLMTNMLPQSPDLNRQIWKELESYERDLARSGKELYIAAGPYGKGGTTGTGTWDYIEIKENSRNAASKNQKILVPSHCWKVILILDEAKDDYNRVNKDTEVLAVMMPNAMGMHKTGTWKNYLVTVDEIEEKTGYDFFAYLPDDIEDEIEAKVYSK